MTDRSVREGCGLVRRHEYGRDGAVGDLVRQLLPIRRRIEAGEARLPEPRNTPLRMRRWARVGKS